MFIGWEGVGLCSFLLIGFWYENEAYATAGRKAFVVNRIGDFCFLLGMFLLFWATKDYACDGSALDFASSPGPGRSAAYVQPFWGGERLAAAAGIFLFIGACGKSRAAAAVRLAARRDGGPDAGLRADPRRDDGDRRRLHGRAGCRSSTRRRRRR